MENNGDVMKRGTIHLKIALCVSFILYYSGCISSSAFAETYKWIDEKGTIHFSDQQPISKEQSKDNQKNVIISNSKICVPPKDVTDSFGVNQIIDCIFANAGHPAFEARFALKALTRAHRDIDIDFKRLQKALPRPLKPEDVPSYIELIAQRKETLGIEDLFFYLHQDMQREAYPSTSALEALLKCPSPEVWERAKKKIDEMYTNGNLKKSRYDYALVRINEQLRDTTKALKNIEAENANISLHEEMQKIKRPTSLGDDTQKRDPELYIREYELYLNKLGQLAKKYVLAPHSVGLRGDIEKGYRELADFIRFQLEQPQRAIPIYDKINEYTLSTEDAGFSYADFIIGDVYQLNIGDKAKSIFYYEKALSLLNSARPSQNDMVARGQRWWKRALESEIQYLKTGKLFEGSINRDDISDMGESLMLQYVINTNSQMSSSASSLNSKGQELSKTNYKLINSHLNLQQQIKKLLNMDEQAMRRFMADNDPAGYWSACVFGAAIYLERMAPIPSKSNGADSNAQRAAYANIQKQQAVLTKVAKKWLEQRKINILAGDARKATPEGTWQLFMESLQSGDAETALTCLMPGMRSKLEQLFKAQSKEEMREIAQTFTAFAMQDNKADYREAIVSRKSPDGTAIAGFVSFVNSGGEWLISAM